MLEISAVNIGVFAKINRYAINTDPQLVRTHEAYGEIQKELNKTFGAPDWTRIKQQVNRLGDGAGIGVLAAAYYTVAAAKTESLSGLAAGLEMLGAALLVDDGDKPPYATLRWMLSNLRDMLHELPTDDAALRDLYRCERMSNTLLRYLQNHRQEDTVPGIYLLERILAQKIQAVKTHIAQAHAQAAAEQPITADDMAAPAKRGGLNMAQLALALLLIALPSAWWLMPQRPDPFSASRQVPQTFSPPVIESYRQRDAADPRKREQRIALYTREIDRLMRQPLGQPLSRAEQLAKTIAQLYPEAEPVNARSAALTARIEQQTGAVDGLYRRFRRARTQAANLARRIARLQQHAPQPFAPELQKLAALSDGLKDYALSLSPMLARADYIEARLSEGDLEQAQAQWRNLNTQLAGLAMISQRLKSGIDQAVLQQTAPQQNVADFAAVAPGQKLARGGLEIDQ